MEKSNTEHTVQRDGLFSPTDAVICTPDGTFSSTGFEIHCHRDLLKAKDIADLMHRVLRFLQRLGFTHFSFTRMASKNPDAAMVLDTNPRAMADHYRHENVWRHDLMLQYATINTAAIFKSNIDSYVDSAPFISETILSNRETHQFVKGFGFHDYYCIPFPAYNGNGNVLMAITAKNRDSIDLQHLAEKYRPALHILARSIDYIGTRRLPKFFLDDIESQEIAVNPRPLQLLRTMAKENLLLNDAAEKLCMSISTANKHIADIKRALDANTTVAALYRAMKEGLID